MNKTTLLRPFTDIFEDDSAVTIVANIAGVEKANLDISVEEHVLTICGEYISEDKKEVKYERQFKIGPDIDLEQISASIKNGVASITLPRLMKTEPKRIAVKIN